MNRRGFLASLIGGLALAVVPATQPPRVIMAESAWLGCTCITLPAQILDIKDGLVICADGSKWHIRSGLGGHLDRAIEVL